MAAAGWPAAVGTGLDGHQIAVPKLVLKLSINGEDSLVVGVNVYLDSIPSTQYDGPVHGQVGGDRDKEKVLELWGQDGAASGQCVSGGTCRCRNDQPVGPLPVDELAVDIGLEFDHAGKIPLVDHHIVQRRGRTVGVDVVNVRRAKTGITQRTLGVESDKCLQIEA